MARERGGGRAAGRPPVALAGVFVANGFGGPSFLARLPDRQDDLGLTDAGLGLTLAVFAIGAFAASPLVGPLIGRFGSRRVVLVAGVVMGGSLPLVGLAPTAVTFALAMAVTGAADAAMDIAMNANGAAHEATSGRSVMHRLHGAWSLGALGAAGLAGLAAATDVPLALHLAVVGTGILAASILANPLLTPDRPTVAAPEVATGGAAEGPGTVPVPSQAPGPAAAEGPVPARGQGPIPATGQGQGRRRGSLVGRVLPAPLLALSATIVGAALVEGGTNDWAALQLQRYGMSAGVAALGVAAFMAGMLAGRSVGDELDERWGGVRLLRTGGLLVAVGLAAGALLPYAAVFIPGTFVAGLGASGFFPLAFSASARIPGVAPGTGAATVSLAARLGFTVEPALMGAIADSVGLRWAYGMVAAIGLVMALSAGRVVPAGAASRGG